jgi:hypothetical protein
MSDCFFGQRFGAKLRNIRFAQHGASNFPQLSEADPGISFKPA